VNHELCAEFIQRTEVSIHTRHFWRVNPQRGHPDSHRGCFNPHPPFLAGESHVALPSLYARGEVMLRMSGS
jgi:hypothetical protein